MVLKYFESVMVYDSKGFQILLENNCNKIEVTVEFLKNPEIDNARIYLHNSLLMVVLCRKQCMRYDSVYLT